MDEGGLVQVNKGHRLQVRGASYSYTASSGLTFSPPSDEPLAEPRSLPLSLPAELRRDERGASSSLVTPLPLLLELSLPCLRMLLEW